MTLIILKLAKKYGTKFENLKFETINAPYPIGFFDEFIDKEICKNLYKEIIEFDNYDDVVMSGRQRK